MLSKPASAATADIVTSTPSCSTFCAHSAPLRVMELFAGIGGFRLGLTRANETLQTLSERGAYEFVWANQWEPNSSRQWAAQVYKARWDGPLINQDIKDVLDDPDALSQLLESGPELLVAGFPCQDYSVANSRAQGLSGAKGALWWQVVKTLQRLQQAGKPVTWLLLENVSRLLTSPTAAPGTDFATILRSLDQLGYALTWRVVNAADYGQAQRRIRLFIVGVHKSSPVFATWKAPTSRADDDVSHWLASQSPLTQTLPARPCTPVRRFNLSTSESDPLRETAQRRHAFDNCGLLINGTVWTQTVHAQESPSSFLPTTLGDVVRATGLAVDERYFLEEAVIPRWRALKGAKRIVRTTPDGYSYVFSEGAMAFPDPLGKPARTLLTSCAGRGASRTTHVVTHPDGRLRLLTPDELDELSGFPRGFTNIPGISDRQRGFLVGNALVTGLIERIGVAISQLATSNQAPDIANP